MGADIGSASPTDLASTFHVSGRKIGPGQPAFIVAEVGQNHDGSPGLAHTSKFQTHIASADIDPLSAES